MYFLFPNTELPIVMLQSSIVQYTNSTLVVNIQWIVSGLWGCCELVITLFTGTTV